MIGLLISSIVNNLSIFKAINFLIRPVVEFCNLVSADYFSIMKDLGDLEDIGNLLDRYQKEIVTLNEMHAGNRKAIAQEIKPFFHLEDGSPNRAGVAIQEFATKLAALGVLMHRINDYSLSNKLDIKPLISRCFHLTLAEKQSLEKSNEANISRGLGIKGMSLIIVVSCKEGELVLKHGGGNCEIIQSFGYVAEPSAIIEECNGLHLEEDTKDINKLADALLYCTKFTAGVINLLIGTNDRLNKTLGTPQLDNGKPKGGITLGGG